MCTVSYFKTKDSMIFTSSRDEKKDRERAIFPSNLKTKDTVLYFPKDKKAFGTWFVADENGNVIILLNGTFQKHENNPPYKKSRGIVLLELAKSKNLMNTFRKYDLSGIEPFQLLAYSQKKLFRLLWDGNVKYNFFLLTHENYLVSSKTLYNDRIEYDRAIRFQKFQNSRKYTANKILNFHKDLQIEKEQDIDASIKEKFITVSITQLILTRDNIEFRYYDLVENTFQKKKIGKRNLV